MKEIDNVEKALIHNVAINLDNPEEYVKAKNAHYDYRLLLEEQEHHKQKLKHIDYLKENIDEIPINEFVSKITNSKAIIENKHLKEENKHLKEVIKEARKKVMGFNNYYFADDVIDFTREDCHKMMRILKEILDKGVDKE